MNYKLTKSQERRFNEGFKVILAIPAPPELEIPADFKEEIVDEFGDLGEYVRHVTLDEIICIREENGSLAISKFWDKSKVCLCAPVFRVHLSKRQRAKKETAIQWPIFEV